MRQVPHACIATLPRIAPPVLQRRFAHSIWGRTIWHDDLHAVRACFGSPLPAASAHPSGRLHILTPRGTEPRPLSELVPAIERGAGDILEGDGGWVAGVSCTEIGVAGPVVAWCTFMRAGTVLDAEAQEHFVTTATPSDIDANAHGSLVRLAASSDSIQHGVEVVWPTEIRRMLENGKEGEKGMRREVLTRAVRRAGLSMMRRNVTTNRLFVDGGTFATESARGKVFCGIPYAPAEGPGVRTCIVLARAMCRYFDSYILQGLHSRYPSYDFASLLHNRNALTREHLRGICILGCVPDVHNVLHRAFVKHRGTHFDGFHPSSEPRPLSLEETARVASALTPVSVKGQCDERGSGVPEQAEAQVNFEAVFAQRAAQAPSSDIVSTAVAPAASDLPRQEVSQLPREEVKARRGGPPAAGPSLPKLSSAISALLDSVAPDGVTEAKRPSPTVPTSSAELELNAPVSGADGGDARTVSHGVLRGADAVVQTISEQKRLLRRRRQQQPVPRADKGDEGTNALDAIMGVDQPSSSRLGMVYPTPPPPPPPPP
eukprot:Rhum_TRINITY_DN13826_c1_g1::Rhum_TRINITY_DN13826_c1_g1_i1::g.64983::m.64983